MVEAEPGFDLGIVPLAVVDPVFANPVVPVFIATSDPRVLARVSLSSFKVANYSNFYSVFVLTFEAAVG